MHFSGYRHHLLSVCFPQLTVSNLSNAESLVCSRWEELRRRRSCSSPAQPGFPVVSCGRPACKSDWIGRPPGKGGNQSSTGLRITPGSPVSRQSAAPIAESSLLPWSGTRELPRENLPVVKAIKPVRQYLHKRWWMQRFHIWATPRANWSAVRRFISQPQSGFLTAMAPTAAKQR